MKKELNGKSRRKFVVGGAMVFGSIALLSTGFATWVIGASNNTAETGIGVDVEGIQNKNVGLTVSLVQTNNTIKFADPKVEGSPVATDGTEFDNKVEIKLTATVNASWLNGAADPGKVQAAFKGTSNLIPATNIAHNNPVVEGWNNRVADAKINAESQDNDAFTVFTNPTLTDTVTATKWVDTQTGTDNVKIFERNMTLTLGIGSTALFGGKASFAAYVNSLYSDDLVGSEAGKLFATKFDMYSDIEKEMKAETDAIKAYFGSNQLGVTISIGETAPVAEN